jgi:hypothetical protein
LARKAIPGVEGMGEIVDTLREEIVFSSEKRVGSQGKRRERYPDFSLRALG